MMGKAGKTGRGWVWRLPGMLTRRRAGILLLAGMVFGYTVVFATTTINEHNRLTYGNYDLGTTDQGLWLLSQLEDPYLTTRGAHMWGDHAWYIYPLIAPVYWLWDDVRALLVFHTLALASGAAIVYKTLQERVGGVAAPLALSFSYLMLPALHYSNLDSGFHPESLTVPLILLAHYFLVKKNSKGYFASVAAAMLCKEEISVTILLFGLYVAVFAKERRAGAVTIAIALCYMILLKHVIFPYYMGEQYDASFQYSKSFGSFGNSMEERIASVTNFTNVKMRVYTDINIAYVKGLLEPVAYLPLASPVFYAAGNLYINLVSDWPYAHELRYHYVSPIIPFIYMALINIFTRLRRMRLASYALAVLLVSAAVYGNYHLGPRQATLRNTQELENNLENPNYYPPGILGAYQLMGQIPSNASVTASYNLVPHLTHRKTIFMYPNPFKTNYYGLDNLQKPPDIYPDYMLVDQALNADLGHITDNLTAGGAYETVGQNGSWVLYRRTAHQPERAALRL